MTMSNQQIETSIKNTNLRIAELARAMTLALNGKGPMPKMPTSGPESMGSGKNPPFPISFPSFPTSQRDPNGSGSGGNERMGKGHQPPFATMRDYGAASTLRHNLKRCAI